MHSSESMSFLIIGDVALDNPAFEVMLRKFIRAPDPGKKSALVLVPFWLNEKCTGKRSRLEYHGNTCTSGIGTTNRPPQFLM